jgi:hypothetical protein
MVVGMKKLIAVVTFLLVAELIRRKQYTSIDRTEWTFSGSEYDWAKYWSRTGRCPQ